jgi:MFS family permease
MKNVGTGNTEKASTKKTFFNLSVFEFLTFLRRGVFYTFMINYLYLLMGTVTSTATLGTLNMMASSAGQNLLWGKICDRYKVRAKLIMAGETIAAFAYIIVFLTHRSLIASGNDFGAGLTIIFGLSILEFFWSMSDVGWAALLADITTRETRGRTVGILNFIASSGRMVGILFAGFLYSDGEGFKNGTIFYIVTIMLFIGAILITFTSRGIKAKCAPEEHTPTDNLETKDEKNDKNRRTYRWFLISLTVVILGASSVNQIFLLFLPLKGGLNATDPEMSFILTAWTVGGMIASLAAGRLSDRIGRAKVLILGLFLAVLTPTLYSFAQNVSFIALVYGLNGVAFWTIQTVGFVFSSDIIPEHGRGRLLSRYNAVMALSWGPIKLHSICEHFLCVISNRNDWNHSLRCESGKAETKTRLN